MAHTLKTIAQCCGTGLLAAWAAWSVTDASFSAWAPKIAFSLAVIVGVCGIALILMTAAARWMRPADAKWMEAQARRFSTLTIAATALAVLFATDLCVSFLAKSPQVLDVAALRVMCTRTSSTPVHVVMATESYKGQWCFQRAVGSVGSGELLRVNIDRVHQPLAIGARSTLQLQEYPSVFLGAGAYTRVKQALQVKSSARPGSSEGMRGPTAAYPAPGIDSPRILYSVHRLS